MANRFTAARRGWAQRETKHVKLVDHILTVKVRSTGRGGRSGRTTTRDLVIPARPGMRKAELLWLAKKYRSSMPARERYAADLLKIPGRTITVAEGPRTRARKVKLR